MASLLGNVQFQILLNEAEIAAIAQGLDRAIQKPAREIVDHLAHTGVAYLRRLDEGVGHAYLAAQWTYDGPVETAAGVQATIRSAAEAKWFKHDTSRATYLIRGSDLLKILEAGAKPHPILPKLGSVLAFRSTLGWHTSLFQGTFRGGGSTFLGTQPRYGLGALIFRKEPEDTLFTLRVDHPGVTGNRFVATTKELLEERMAMEAAQLLSRVKLEAV